MNLEPEPEPEPELQPQPQPQPDGPHCDRRHLVATVPIDLTPVHQRLMPGIWSRLRLDTFPENWLVLRVMPGATGDTAGMKGIPAGAPPGVPQAHLERYGRGGLQQVAELLAAADSVENETSVRYAACRVSILSTEGLGGSVFVWLSWFGTAVSLGDRAHVLERDRRILRDYFTSATELQVDSPATQPATMDAATLYQFLSDATTTALHVKLGLNCEIDFKNAGCVAECTHYQDDRNDSEVPRDRQLVAHVDECNGEEDTITDDFYSEYVSHLHNLTVSVIYCVSDHSPRQLLHGQLLLSF